VVNGWLRFRGDYVFGSLVYISGYDAGKFSQFVFTRTLGLLSRTFPGYFYVFVASHVGSASSLLQVDDQRFAGLNLHGVTPLCVQSSSRTSVISIIDHIYDIHVPLPRTHERE
jgi:hypothetical protein